MVKPLTSGDLIKIAVDGGEIPIDRALATYGDPDNWGQINDESGCHWVWKGPVICGYELGEMTIRRSQKE